jgi:hypothetical protein
MCKKTLQKTLQKNNISPQKPKFEIIENVMVISIKNPLKDGVDLDCFNTLKLIYPTIGPLEES